MLKREMFPLVNFNSEQERLAVAREVKQLEERDKEQAEEIAELERELAQLQA